MRTRFDEKVQSSGIFLLSYFLLLTFTDALSSCNSRRVARDMLCAAIGESLRTLVLRPLRPFLRSGNTSARQKFSQLVPCLGPFSSK